MPAPHHPPERVAVVGAGMVGLATAWFLQEAGVDVTVLDREGVAAGASGGNAGGATPGPRPPPPRTARPQAGRPRGSEPFVAGVRCAAREPAATQVPHPLRAQQHRGTL